MITIDMHSYFYNNEKKSLMNSSSGAATTVEYGTSNTNTTISPNTFYKWDEVTELTLALGAETPGTVNEYIFQFISGSKPTTLILPDSVKFNSEFTVEANKIYQVSILNGLGTAMSWDI